MPTLFKNPAAENQYLAAYDRVLADWAVPFETVEAPTRFGATHALVSGPPAAPPLVLLPGNFASATMWHPNIAGLSRSRRVYALDIIGNPGKCRATHPPRTRTGYAGWLVDTFEQLDLDRVAVAGLSYGAFLALNLALHTPERVTHLILLSPDLPLARPTLRGMRFAAAMMLFPTRKTVSQFLQRTSIKGYAANDPYFEQRLIGNTGVRSLRHLRPHVTHQELRELKTPTLILWGQEELLVNPLEALQTARRLIPHLEAEIIPNAGHALNRDQPQQVNARLLEFIQRR
ncbi:MAG: alpha/beta hydrolase [Anaerolineae bacterium]|nr:alpha/beta hydrolase [Anaerolineae bacterium]